MLSIAEPTIPAVVEPELRRKIAAEVRSIFPTQKWESALAFVFYEGSDDSPDDMANYCASLRSFILQHASVEYLANRSLSMQYENITERSAARTRLDNRIVNCSDLKAQLGAWDKNYHLEEHLLISTGYDYIFDNLRSKTPSAARADLASANSFRSLGMGAVGPQLSAKQGLY
jgi:hypothetical protein